jgi:hypothetical protein
VATLAVAVSTVATLIVAVSTVATLTVAISTVATLAVTVLIVASLTRRGAVTNRCISIQAKNSMLLKSSKMR